MKILFISRRFYPDIIGGGEISAFHIAKAVKQQGNNVYVLTFTDDDKLKEELIDGLRIFRVPIGKLNSFPRFSNMDYMFYQISKLSSKFIPRINPDVIHLLNFDTVPMTAMHLKKKFKIPIVATVNGPLFGCFTQNSIDYKGETCVDCRIGKRYLCSTAEWGMAKGTMYYGYSLWHMNMLKLSYKYVDRFFVVSKAMSPLLTNMGVPRRKITLVHNPIGPGKKVKTKLEKKLGIEKKKVILYAGRLAENKGIHQTIKAMGYLDNVVFLILGQKRDYYTELKNLVKKLELEDKVMFTGFVPQEKMAEYYSIADAAVLVESFYEPLSRFLLEAMSYGIPIIANDIGGNREIVDDGKNGYLIKDKSPGLIAERINSISKLRKVKELCRKKIAEEFSESVVGKKLMKEYAALS